MSKIIGIDLGTTFSAVAMVQEGRPQILPKGDERVIPSVVGLNEKGELLVGTPALNQFIFAPERTVRSIKRKMGTDEKVSLGDRLYTPQEISAFILRELKQIAEANLGEKVEKAVITVPAYFNDAQRQATRDAGEIAGLDVVRIINEPTAAALAYGLDREVEQLALVYDLGGGTFDVSLVEISNGVIEVKASHGNTRLGGDDFDERLAKVLVERFERRHKISLKDPKALARVNRAAERAKIALSDHPYTWVREEFLAEKRGVPLHLEEEISRHEFEALIEDLLLSTLEAVNRSLEDGKVSPRDLDLVLLVGGSTFIPRVQEMLAEHLGQEPKQAVNPREAVALGAAVQAAIIAGEPVEAILVDITAHSLGIEVAERRGWDIIPGIFKVLIPRNTPIPVTKEEVFTPLFPDQETVRIRVYQGESPVAADNTLLGEFMVEGLRPEVPGRYPEVLVQFSLDVDGILRVEATDKRTGEKKGITIAASPVRMSTAEIARAKAEMALWDEEAGPLLARARLLLKEGDLEEEDEATLRKAVEALEEALRKGDPEELEECKEDLWDVLYELEEE